MNKTWFICKVKFLRNTDGADSQVTEQFLLDAYKYTEAETRMSKIMEASGQTPFEIKQITKTNYAEVIHYDDADYWFKVKVSFVSFDEASGKEKGVNQFFLMCAADIEDATKKTHDLLKSTISGYVIPSVTYTKIVDVFPLDMEVGAGNGAM
ncbi:DUF4494 domain-containing protein [Sanyastnella coralliicola]|uniref:DUF4494 domain-containing protein n=1 Tax=Sanyastnella coralliicola TaxID=3069118 RepID=UPI0027BAB86E|nr:DUF4494 domain-containing protein [Longitalea sp. SCSIO 12813]